MFKYFPLAVINAVGSALGPVVVSADHEATKARSAAFVRLAGAVAFVVLTLAAQIGLQSYVVHHAAAFAQWADRLPYGLLIWDDASWGKQLGHKGNLLTLAMFAVVCAQSVALYLLTRTLAARLADRVTKTLLVLGSGVMVMSALGMNVANADMYAYSAYAHLTTAQAYHPVSGMFGGSLAVLNDLPNHLWTVNKIIGGAWYGLEPAPYGPLWLALAHHTIGATANLGLSLLIDRLISTTAFAVCIYALIRLRTALPVLAAFALNPAIIFEAIADGHNDIIAVAFILGGITIAKKHPWAGTALSALAGLIKVPYLPISLLVTAELRGLSRRIVAGFAIVGAVCAISFFGGGIGYLQSLVHHVAGNAGHEPLGETLAHDAVGLGALVAIAAACLNRRYFPAAAYFFPAFFASVHSWYLIAGIPYILQAGSRPFVTFLILMPMVGMEMQIFYNYDLMSYALFCGIFAVGCYGAAQRFHSSASEIRSSP